MSVTFHESNRNHGFKRVKELVVFRAAGGEPERLGTIHVDEKDFKSEWAVQLTRDELNAIAERMDDAA